MGSGLPWGPSSGAPQEEEGQKQHGRHVQGERVWRDGWDSGPGLRDREGPEPLQVSGRGQHPYLAWTPWASALGASCAPLSLGHRK